MLRKIGFILLALSATLSANLYAMQTHSIMPGITIDYDLVPNEPQVFVNYLFWPIEANCKITTVDESNTLQAEMLSKKGKINGQEITAGQSITVTVHNGENLKINADSGAKVKIINQGAHTITASCSA